MAELRGAAKDKLLARFWHLAAEDLWRAEIRRLGFLAGEISVWEDFDHRLARLGDDKRLTFGRFVN
jgi:hypothetical protein